MACVSISKTSIPSSGIRTAASARHTVRNTTVASGGDRFLAARRTSDKVAKPVPLLPLEASSNKQ